MSDHRPPPPSDRPATGKGAGITLGCLTVPVVVIAVSLIAATRPATAGWVFAVVAFSVVLLAAAVFYGRRMPGFLRGIAWFFGIFVILFTACVGIITASGGF